MIGDIMGEPGRRAVARLLPKLIAKHSIDVVIGNGENVAGGFGITPDLVDERVEQHEARRERQLAQEPDRHPDRIGAHAASSCTAAGLAFTPGGLRLASELMRPETVSFLDLMLRDDSAVDDGQEPWDLVSRDGMNVAYGVYLFHVDAPGVGESIGRFALIK